MIRREVLGLEDEMVGVLLEIHRDINLTFSLSPNWSFVPTENWRKDVRGDWIEGEVDRDGWSCANDAWLNPVEKELEGKITVTRRRRWINRVWFGVAAAGSGPTALVFLLLYYMLIACWKQKRCGDFSLENVWHCVPSQIYNFSRG
ncbi:hypothetical protein DL96DRAFT_724900 [Flagelloscypha sp. PMI_526]|nr:hypothetical protein DL96DRAFT_724900 [Flagelloscypha sp. PMI_526]